MVAKPSALSSNGFSRSLFFLGLSVFSSPSSSIIAISFCISNIFFFLSASSERNAPHKPEIPIARAVAKPVIITFLGIKIEEPARKIINIPLTIPAHVKAPSKQLLKNLRREISPKSDIFEYCFHC